MMFMAMVLLFGQAAIISVVLLFVRRFTAYADALLEAHQSNLMIRERISAEMEELRRTKETYLVAVKAGKVA